MRNVLTSNISRIWNCPFIRYVVISCYLNTIIKINKIKFNIYYEFKGLKKILNYLKLKDEAEAEKYWLNLSASASSLTSASPPPGFTLVPEPGNENIW